jgi:hypothetical protein
MTRKDYCAIAGAINRAQTHDEWEGGDIPWAIWLTAEYVADALAADNPRFDRQRFMDACGVEQ